ncbi:BMC domain protein [Geobacillus kaustophilus]|uniref:BMC domain protein n=1 Tax=Geobacillus kaustophilus TaxID=1462 RepID=A0A0D8BSZ6_GEOKU|nr:BMC domain-containing protein [Geobacillus kaustophilus]KJE27313.1 BMC domain protein [Geobacillus kaustophilus]
MEKKERIIQEFVPGKQLNLAHIIAHPNESLYTRLGITEPGAIGILTVTPTETAIIAADIATKSAHVEIGYLDRFTGSVVIVGDLSDVETAIRHINEFFVNTLKFSTAEITRS